MLKKVNTLSSLDIQKKLIGNGVNVGTSKLEEH